MRNNARFGNQVLICYIYILWSQKFKNVWKLPSPIQKSPIKIFLNKLLHVLTWHIDMPTATFKYANIKINPIGIDLKLYAKKNIVIKFLSYWVNKSSNQNVIFNNKQSRNTETILQKEKHVESEEGPSLHQTPGAVLTVLYKPVF